MLCWHPGPDSFVLASLDAGEYFERLRASYSFLTQAHVLAAREFAATHELDRGPRAQDGRAGWRLVKRRVLRGKGDQS